MFQKFIVLCWPILIVFPDMCLNVTAPPWEGWELLGFAIATENRFL